MDRKLQRGSNRKKSNKRIFNILLLGIFVIFLIVFVNVLNNVPVAYAQDSQEMDIIDITSLMANDEINDYPFGLNSIEINANEERHYLLTERSLVSDLLLEAGVEYDGDDIVIPRPEVTVAPGAKITVIRIFNERVEELHPIPFQTIYEEDPDLPIGEQRVVQDGIEGQKLLVYTQLYEDGEFVSKTLKSEEVQYEPTDHIIAKGTRRIIPRSTLQSGTCDSWDAVIDGATADEGERMWLKHLMRCESGCNAGRVSYNGTYHGLFQFHPRTFAANGGTDIYDGNQQIPMVLNYVRAGVQYTQFPGCTGNF